mmetsp:Transcript_39462/g.106509  ORF Transcript_39462/g.106509 Transcript_39462/m.106509 type:complete len:218 (-) Transcript_39462:160-813(-)
MSTVEGGFGVLHGACGMLAADNIQIFIDVCAESAAKGVSPQLNLGLQAEFNGATALAVSAYMGSCETTEVLLKAGANRTKMNDHGATVLHDAACNSSMAPEVLDLLWDKEAVNINHQRKPRNMKWWVIDRVFETIYRYNIDRSDLARTISGCRYSTPLHEAAYCGNLSTCKWLLANGGQKSLELRNKMGRTPLHNAILCQHDEVAKLLEGAAASSST